jgi:hypothetical protein
MTITDRRAPVDTWKASEQTASPTFKQKGSSGSLKLGAETQTKAQMTERSYWTALQEITSCYYLSILGTAHPVVGRNNAPHWARLLLFDNGMKRRLKSIEEGVGLYSF